MKIQSYLFSSVKLVGRGALNKLFNFLLREEEEFQKRFHFSTQSKEKECNKRSLFSTHKREDFKKWYQFMTPL